MIRALFGLLFLVAAAAWWHFVESPGAFARPFNDSKLGIFEYRIGSIADEMMRRSPKLRKNYEEFKVCPQTRGCDAVEVSKRRDAIVVQEWPAVFDRLTVHRDWGAYYLSAAERDNFFAALKKHGHDRIRADCVPKLEYWKNRVYSSSAYTLCANGARALPRAP